MKQVFTAYNLSDAYLVKSLLDAEGIESVVRNEAFLMEQATSDGLPGVWILDDTQYEKAASIASSYIEGGRQAEQEGASWKCTKCGEMLESQFTACWQCGTDRPERK